MLLKYDWSKYPERTKYLRLWYLHWGAKPVADDLKLDFNEVRSRANCLGLKMLPRGERLCRVCRTRKQVERKHRQGFLCDECYSQRRMELRRRYVSQDSLTERLRGIAASARLRAKHKGYESDITTESLRAHWDQQKGRCFYTGRPMIASAAIGRGRNPDAISIDKIVPADGYRNSNIVLCTWWANSAKGELSVEEFRIRCNEVAEHKPSLR